MSTLTTKLEEGFNLFEMILDVKDKAADQGLIQTVELYQTRLIQLKSSITDIIKKCPPGFLPPIEDFQEKYRGVYRTLLKNS